MSSPYNIPSAGPSTVITSPSALTSAHGLAGLVGLVYIRIGNEVMAQALGKLETAVTATQSSLSILTDLQGLHNQIAVGAPGSLPFNFTAANTSYTYATTLFTNTVTTVFTNSIITIITFTGLSTITTGTPLFETRTLNVSNRDSYVSAYQILGSAFYKPIDPYFAITTAGSQTAVPITQTTSADFWANASQEAKDAFTEFRTQLLNSKATISGLIAQLSAITPLTPQGGVDPTTLLAKLHTVYSELPSGSFVSCRAWILDSYTIHGSSGVVKAGQIQQHITNAITAGESLNSSQTASVRQYMFIFEQYYQSAAAVISAINQSMQSIARKISG